MDAVDIKYQLDTVVKATVKDVKDLPLVECKV